MKTAGIIAEYNPFHNGHSYHISETKKQTGADYVVAVMSGDYVQRGAPAILDKYARAEAALKNGVDLVIELPLISALSSAEGFARGGVSLLGRLGIIDAISFGCEADVTNQNGLHAIADLLTDEPPLFSSGLQKYLRDGDSFPRARERAVRDCLGEQAGTLLAGPNNILAIEYLKAQKKYAPSLQPVMITRTGNDYHNTDLTGTCSSATAIRRHLKEEDDILSVKQSVPANTWEMFLQAHLDDLFVSEADFSTLLFYALLEKTGENSSWQPENPSLFSRIRNSLESCRDWVSFALSLKTKNLTLTAVNRSLVHILLGISKQDFALVEQYACAPYARVLGFQKKASPLLAKLQENCQIPLLMKLASDVNTLDDGQRHLFEQNRRASDLYHYVRSAKSNTSYQSEYRRPLIYA